MKIAVINELTTAHRNEDIMLALEKYDHEVYNLGMKNKETSYSLQYNQISFLAALLLNGEKVDLVIGGCSTGQGFAISSMQYPSVITGHISTPLDAYLFSQINGGNCLSLVLNQGYGWGSDINLEMILDAFFKEPLGNGYPPSRKEAQKISRNQLMEISHITHKSMAEIITLLSKNFVKEALNYPGIKEFLDIDSLPDKELATSIHTVLS